MKLEVARIHFLSDVFVAVAVGSLPADVLGGSFVTHSFLPHVRGGEMNA